MEAARTSEISVDNYFTRRGVPSVETLLYIYIYVYIYKFTYIYTYIYVNFSTLSLFQGVSFNFLLS
jgi:hypothetical protein